ncbi:MAG: YbdK family carboxylate-amine ligase [Thermodesulfobacteriota bacterium]
MSVQNGQSNLEEVIHFAPSNPFTLGVELEFQTLDRETLNLAPLAPILLDSAPAILQPRITHEWIRSILEIRTGICRSVFDVENDLLQTCSMAEELAADHNCLLFAASLHPFADPKDQILTADNRYERIMEELQIVGRRFISQGFHVHVGMKDGDNAIKCCDLIQPYLPLFVALSASSPYFCGEDTGLQSYRTKLFEALPLAGIYERIKDWDHFIEEVSLLKKVGVIESIKDLWWDARPHPSFGTLEIRACDLPIRYSHILGLVALVQAFVATLCQEHPRLETYSQQVLRCNKWQAVRYGIDGSFIDPLGYLTDERISIGEAVKRLIKKSRPMIDRFQTQRYISMLDHIFENGPGSVFQRRLYKEYGDFNKVITRLHNEFWN